MSCKGKIVVCGFALALALYFALYFCSTKKRASARARNEGKCGRGQKRGQNQILLECQLESEVVESLVVCLCLINHPTHLLSRRTIYTNFKVVTVFVDKIICVRVCKMMNNHSSNNSEFPLEFRAFSLLHSLDRWIFRICSFQLFLNFPATAASGDMHSPFRSKSSHHSNVCFCNMSNISNMCFPDSHNCVHFYSVASTSFLLPVHIHWILSNQIIHPFLTSSIPWMFSIPLLFLAVLSSAS